MLTHIHIKHFTIVDELDLELKSGMTVLTGETGAGKSIIIDAILLALGGRAAADLVRTGCTRAEISLQFDISQNQALQIALSKQDLDDDNTCLIRRTIHADGRSKCFINDTPCTLQTIKPLAELLINIHGQHEFQNLLRPELQRKTLDQFAHADKLTAEIHQLYRDWQAKKLAYDALVNQGSEAKARAEFLKFQLAEFQQLQFSQHELTQLEQEQKQLSHAENLMADCQNTLNSIADDEHAALNQLNIANLALDNITQINPELKSAADLIREASIQIEEAHTDIRHYFDRLELNPERLRFVEQRLSKAYELARKHQIKVEHLPQHVETLQKELDQLESADSTIATLQKDIDQIVQQYQQQAKKLSALRKKVGQQLSKLISDNMQTLHMKGGVFAVQLEPLDAQQLHPHGSEKVHFLVSANPGQPLKPLNKVASGGELSRISLAIQVITASRCQTPSLVFDEVDVGIGGATADMVGKLLRELSKNTQVLCITHLAQVASKGHQHLRVNKQSDNKQTTSSINTLQQEERILEIARMAGGTDINEATLAHAKAMLTSMTETQ